MQSPTQAIKDKLPIADVVGGYVKLERAGRSLRARCPFHKERTASFYVSPERGSYYCFGCGEKGDIFSFVQKIDGLEFRDALKALAERAGVPLTEYKGEKGPTKDEKERLYDLHEAATAHFESVLAKRTDVLEYLQKRGLTPETISKWRLGYAEAQWRSLTEVLRAKGFTDEELAVSGLSIKAEKGSEVTYYDRFRGRIMFPIGDVGGRIIAFSGRHFESMPGGKETEPAKYMNSPETPLFRKSKVLYGLDRAKATMRRYDFALLVEGQMDLLMMHQSGYPSAVAASGTALTEEHLRAISHLSKRLVLALDSDAAGQKSALRSAGLALTEGFDVRIAAFPEGKDPADVGREDVEALKRAVREAKTAVEFFLESARKRSKDERTVRRVAEAEVIPLIARMQSSMDKAHFIQVAARALDLPEDSVRMSVAAVKVTAGIDAEAVTAPEALGLSRLIHASALIALSDDAPAKERLAALIGAERMAEAEAAAALRRDELLFSLERDDEPHSNEELLRTVEREINLERITTATRALKEADQAGNMSEVARLSNHLTELKRELEK